MTNQAQDNQVPQTEAAKPNGMLQEAVSKKFVFGTIAFLLAGFIGGAVFSTDKVSSPSVTNYEAVLAQKTVDDFMAENSMSEQQLEAATGMSIAEITGFVYGVTKTTPGSDGKETIRGMIRRRAAIQQ